MESQEVAGKRFGSYLRRVREGRHLSLDAVEELSSGHAERVTKSHLSRIENGQAVPSFPRLCTLSRIYGVPVASLAEQFEIDLRPRQVSPEVMAKPEHEMVAEAEQLRTAGRYLEALEIFEALLHRQAGNDRQPEALLDWRLHRANCLVRLGCYGLAKDECEEMLNIPGLAVGRRLLILENFIMCCVHLRRFTVAMMALEQAESGLSFPEAPIRLRADLAAIRGYIHIVTGSPPAAIEWYLRAIDLYEEIKNPFEACRCRVNLAHALMEAGDSPRAREVLEAALSVAEASGYDRHKALALGNLALLCFREGDTVAAEGYALRSNAIARPLEYISLVFRNCYYLWKIARDRGDGPGVRANERTLRTYVTRVEEQAPEVHEFRAHLLGERA